MPCIKIPSEDFIFIGEKIESMANKYIFGPMNMSLSSMRVLGYVNSKKTTTAKELIRLTGKSKSNISQRLAILERNGFIIRIKNENNKDGRETFLKITSLGESKVKEAMQKIKKFHLSKEKYFSRKEISGHIKFMQKLIIFLEEEDSKLKEIFNK
ncbi:MAG: MarR family transcriptional regulator [Parcubacteria group bacterium]|jgi:DNA-binding MarR family transcriptional regulator